MVLGGHMEDDEPYRAEERASSAAERLADFLHNRMQMQHVYQPVMLSAPKGDKYQSRIDAKVACPSGDVSAALLAAGLVRPYNGGRRQGWC